MLILKRIKRRRESSLIYAGGQARVAARGKSHSKFDLIP
jgi:hypothetical protein